MVTRPDGAFRRGLGSCRGAGPRAVLAVSIDKKQPQPLEDAYAIAFAYRLVAATPEYLNMKWSEYLRQQQAP